MKAAQKDTSGVFDSILVHFNDDKARYDSTHLKLDRSIITVPSAWAMKPMTEVRLKVQPPAPKSKKGRPIECHGIIVACRPQKKKGHFHVDLLLTDLPTKDASKLRRLATVPEAQRS